jgi:hypothetical protein
MDDIAFSYLLCNRVIASLSVFMITFGKPSMIVLAMSRVSRSDAAKESTLLYEPIIFAGHLLATEGQWGA